MDTTIHLRDQVIPIIHSECYALITAKIFGKDRVVKIISQDDDKVIKAYAFHLIERIDISSIN